MNLSSWGERGTTATLGMWKKDIEPSNEGILNLSASLWNLDSACAAYPSGTKCA